MAAVSGVVTTWATAHSTLGLWVSLAVLVIIGAALQVWVTLAERDQPRRVEASGPGAVAIGGSAAEIRTFVRGSHDTVAVRDDGDGIIASAPGAISIGGNAAGALSTDVTDGNGSAQPRSLPRPGGHDASA